MNLCCPRGPKNLCGIANVDTAARQDADASGSLTDKRFQQGDARLRRRSLTAGEDALKAQPDEGLQSGMGVAAHIEGTMEGEGYGRDIADTAFNGLQEGGGGGGHETLTGCFIYIALRGQRTDHYPIGTGLARQTDIADDDCLFGGVIEKITGTRTHQDMTAHFCYLHSSFYQCQAGSQTAFGKT